MKPDLPDWRLASAYPVEAPARWWAWQFLRRNPSYQSDYAQWAAAITQHAADYDKVDMPDATPMLERWGIVAMLNPADDAHHLTPIASPSPRPIHHAMERPRIHEVVLKFDLRYPIDRQIEYAKAYLMGQAEHQQRVHEFRGSTPLKFSAKGPHKRKLPEYLRALDASLEGATVREVAETLYPRLARELTRDAGMVRAEEAISRGQELSDSGYRDLMAWA
ncbi:DNA -binding domain-containing protein [Thauera sp.]